MLFCSLSILHTSGYNSAVMKAVISGYDWLLNVIDLLVFCDSAKILKLYFQTKSEIIRAKIKREFLRIVHISNSPNCSKS